MTDTFLELQKEIKKDGQPSRVLQGLVGDLLANDMFKEFISQALNTTTFNETDEENYNNLGCFGFKDAAYRIATNEWYLDHFLKDENYPEGVIQSECGLDLEEIVDVF